MAKSAKELEKIDMKLHMPVERPVTVYLNGVEIVTIQTSLGFLEELAAGFLVAEGILAGADDLRKITVDERKGMVWVEAKGSKEIAGQMVGKRFLTSGCGKGFSFSNPGDLRGLGVIESSFKISKGRLTELMKEVLIEGRRPGLHCSALADLDGIVALRHDIGRHNTVDMLVGHLFLSGRSGGGLVMMTTGRISYEMAVKAAKAKIPVIATRSAATDLAVEVSEKIGVEVAGYVRGRDVVVYTNLGRVAD
ncbi:MAG: formate dehydrogenase accessory sulfurtransferase FdhD [Actinobacteria bacterium]|nr:formate dehydrogenase accessory sulfurtransferase FdhD [Actinomycetota bacterium]